MYDEIVLEFEVLPTDLAGMSFVCLVGKFMSIQSGSLSESLPTRVAHVRLLPTVNQ